MHKIRNTKHIDILNSMLGIIPAGYSEPLSKKTIRKILTICNWNKKEAIESINSGEWSYWFCKD